MDDLANLGILSNLYNEVDPDLSLEVFKRICFTRYFELECARVYKEGLIHSPVYFSLGQESISAAVSTVISNYYIFAQHRAHSVYLAFGGDPVKLIDELLCRPGGCCGGRGGSPMIEDANIKMVGHHGLIGENVPLAVGFALGSKNNTVCFFGDAAAEEDYVFGAIGFASTHKLPVLFVCEDNDLSILTHKKARRNWETADVARALKMPGVDITDDPWLVMRHTKELCENLPAFINVRTCRHLWHAGAGVDGPPEWDRFELVKQKLEEHGIGYNKAEEGIKSQIRELWAKQLQRQ